MFSLNNRIVLVTGSGSGIGKATAVMLGELGATVIVVDQNKQTSEGTVDLLRTSNVTVHGIVVDIFDPTVIQGDHYGPHSKGFETSSANGNLEQKDYNNDKSDKIPADL